MLWACGPGLWAGPGRAPRLEDVSSWPPLTICSVQKAGSSGEGVVWGGGQAELAGWRVRPPRPAAPAHLRFFGGLGSGDLGGAGRR